MVTAFLSIDAGFPDSLSTVRSLIALIRASPVVLSRSEIIKDVLDSKNILRMKRLIERFKLTSEELELFKGISIDVDDTISYYQLGDKEVYQRKIKKDIS